MMTDTITDKITNTLTNQIAQTKLKLIAVSDLHVDEEGQINTIAYETIDDILKIDADILLVGGDIAKSKKILSQSLNILKQFKGLKLAYLGNHELESITESKLGTHYYELEKIFEENNFHLLDSKPYIYEGIDSNIGFVGNSGFFDFSLYREENIQKAENNKKKALQAYYIKYGSENTTPEAFTEHCISRIREDISKIEDKCDQIILGIHHVGFSDQLKYGHSELFNYKNIFMGSKKLAELYNHPKIKIGFCGHNHRSGKFRYNNCDVYNISSDNNKPYTELELQI